MKITVNGQVREIAPDTSLKALVELLALKGDRIACERNLEVVPRSRYSETMLADGDKLEIVTFVGGG